LKQKGSAIVPETGVIVPCHNDAKYLARCVGAIIRSGAGRVILVLDRCTDDSIDVASSFPAEIIEKRVTRWRNSTAENLEIGFERLLDCEYVSVIAADTVVPLDYVAKTTSALDDEPGLASVASTMHCEPSTLFNKLYRGYEDWLDRVGLKHAIRGSGRMYRMSVVRKLYERTGHVFQDCLAEDSRLDDELGGTRRSLEEVRAHSIREVGLGKCIWGQVMSGRSRSQLGKDLYQSVGEIPRLRVFVFFGYMLQSLIGGDPLPLPS
jgi:cellulose synthase/poly-beta-1,6-N-acetylglucosamine synthase-like glycosyltransferase